MDRATPLQFLFDFVSPFAYVAWGRIRALAAREARTVEAVPVLLGAILSAYGTKGPAEVPAKRRYMFKEVCRKAHRAGMPLVPPPTHPFNPLVALRVASVPMEPAQQARLIDALYGATWAGGGGIESPADVARVVTAAGLDGEGLVAAASESSIKERLRKQTDWAILRGVFGVPTVLAGEELFWGVDALDDLVAFLRGEDPVTPELVARWNGLTASATRKT